MASYAGYSRKQNSQSYATSTEQVIIRRGAGMGTVDFGHSPRKELYKNHGVGHDPFLRPRSLAHAGSQEDDEFSPKAPMQVIHGQSKGNNVYGDISPPSRDRYYYNTNDRSQKVDGKSKGSSRNNVYGDNSPPSRDRYNYNTNDRPQKADEFPRKAPTQVVHGQSKGSPRNNVYGDNSPPSRDRYYFSTNDRPHKADEFPRKAPTQVVHGQSKGSPRNNVYGDNSPPSRDRYYYSSDDQSDDEDDGTECVDGVCFRPQTGASSYTVPVGTPPRKEPTSYADNNDKHKVGNGAYSPPSYTVPDTYTSSNNKPVNNPPPIKTRIQTSRGRELPKESPKSSPGSPDGRRKYGRGSDPRAGSIDSKTAAAMYNGVLISDR